MCVGGGGRAAEFKHGIIKKIKWSSYNAVYHNSTLDIGDYQAHLWHLHCIWGISQIPK